MTAKSLGATAALALRRRVWVAVLALVALLPDRDIGAQQAGASDHGFKVLVAASRDTVGGIVPYEVMAAAFRGVSDVEVVTKTQPKTLADQFIVRVAPTCGQETCFAAVALSTPDKLLEVGRARDGIFEVLGWRSRLAVPDEEVDDPAWDAATDTVRMAEDSIRVHLGPYERHHGLWPLVWTRAEFAEGLRDLVRQIDQMCLEKKRMSDRITRVWKTGAEQGKAILREFQKREWVC